MIIVNIVENPLRDVFRKPNRIVCVHLYQQKVKYLTSVDT